MIAVVDLKISNLASVLHALRLVGGGEYQLATPDGIVSAAAVILPGVGAFADGMASLREQGLVEPIRRAAAARTPIFGICLGMQMLASVSEEFGEHVGLGLIPGRVVAVPNQTTDGQSQKIPHVGWNELSFSTRLSLMIGIETVFVTCSGAKCIVPRCAT